MGYILIICDVIGQVDVILILLDGKFEGGVDLCGDDIVVGF